MGVVSGSLGGVVGGGVWGLEGLIVVGACGTGLTAAGCKTAYEYAVEDGIAPGVAAVAATAEIGELIFDSPKSAPEAIGDAIQRRR